MDNPTRKYVIDKLAEILHLTPIDDLLQIWKNVLFVILRKEVGYVDLNPLGHHNHEINKKSPITEDEFDRHSEIRLNF